MLLMNQEADSDKVNILVYGRSGTGKTTLGVTAPKPIIFASERQAWDAIQDAARRMGIDTPPTFFISTKHDLVSAVRALYAKNPMEVLVRTLTTNAEKRAARQEKREVNQEQIEADIADTLAAMPYTNFETVVLDSITDYFRLIAEDIDEQAPPKIGKDGLPSKAERYWQVLRERSERMIRQFRDTPFNVLYLALLDDRMVGEDDQKTRQVGPDCPMRALPNALMASVNMVGIASVQLKMRKEQDALLKHWVRFAAPDWMMTKPKRPLRDVEVPNVSDWVKRLREPGKVEPLDLGQGIPTEAELELGPPKKEDDAGAKPPADGSESEPPSQEPGENSEATGGAQGGNNGMPRNGKELLAALRGALPETNSTSELAAVWLKYIDVIESCQSKAPKTYDFVGTLFEKRASQIADEVVSQGKSEPGTITAEDIIEKMHDEVLSQRAE
jgi:hypothetical protein